MFDRWKALFVCGAVVLAGAPCLAAEPSATTAVPPKAGISALVAAAVEKAADGQDRYLNFSFDQVEVRNFVKLVGEMTGRRLIIDENVKGKITVVYPKIAADEVFPVFVSILESVGCSVVEEQEGVYRVVAMAARPAPSAPVIGPDEAIPASGVVTKIIRLEFVSAVELQKALESKVSGGKEGAIGVIETTNHIIVTDTAENIRRIEKIVAEVDRPGLARTTEVVALKYAGSEEVAEQLTRAMSESEEPSAAGSGRGRIRNVLAQPTASTSSRRAVVVASPHSNSLIIVGAPSQISELKRIISLMDVDSPTGMGRLSAIFLKYITAEEAATSLNALLANKAAQEKTSAAQPPKIAIQPHTANNALLVDAMPRDFELVRELVQQLDRPPEQVLIEVLIAEVSLRDELDIGVSMAAVDLPSDAGSTVVQGGSFVKEGANDLMTAIQAGLFPEGLSIGLAHGVGKDEDGNVISSTPALLNVDAIQKNGKFNILSNIPLLAQNNKEASVNIVDNIPILQSTIQGGSGTARDIIQNIQRIDVGIKLKLTPHIIPGGEVMMALNPSIEAVIDPGSINQGLAPTIARRDVSTTVTVPDGETIVLSGLIREDQTQTVRKVPVLGSIPLLGWLFRHKVKGSEKTNLLIFVTPHVVTDRNAAKRITQSWGERTSLGGTNVISKPPTQPEAAKGAHETGR